MVVGERIRAERAKMGWLLVLSVASAVAIASALTWVATLAAPELFM